MYYNIVKMFFVVKNQDVGSITEMLPGASRIGLFLTPLENSYTGCVVDGYSDSGYSSEWENKFLPFVKSVAVAGIGDKNMFAMYRSEENVFPQYHFLNEQTKVAKVDGTGDALPDYHCVYWLLYEGDSHLHFPDNAYANTGALRNIFRGDNIVFGWGKIDDDVRSLFQFADDGWLVGRGKDEAGNEFHKHGIVRFTRDEDLQLHPVPLQQSWCKIQGRNTPNHARAWWY